MIAAEAGRPERQRILPWLTRSGEKLLDMGIVLEDTREGVKWKTGVNIVVAGLSEGVPAGRRRIRGPVFAAGAGLHRRRGLRDCMIRTKVVNDGSVQVNKLHKQTCGAW